VIVDDFDLVALPLVPEETDTPLVVDPDAVLACALPFHACRKSATCRSSSLRVARLLGHSPESWIRMQEALDLWKLAQDPSRLKGIEPLPPSRIAA